jgi:hypothetical protein
MQRIDRGPSGSRVFATLLVHRHPDDAFAAQAEKGERLQQAHVDFPADHDLQRRCAIEPARFYVPSRPGEQVVTGRGEAGEVGHGGSGDEAGPRVRWETENVDHPPQRDLLDLGGRGRERPYSRALVPCCGEPGGGE